MRWWLADSSLDRVEGGRLSGVIFFDYFMNIVCYQEWKKDGRQECVNHVKSLDAFCTVIISPNSRLEQPIAN